MAADHDELAAVDECTCGHLWDQHYAAAGRQGFCLSHCGCRGFIGVGRKSAVHLAAGRPEMPDHDESGTPEQRVAYLLWQVNEGYLTAEDRAIGTNWFLTPVGSQPPDDEAERQGWLDAAAEVIAIIEAKDSGSREAPDGR